MKCIHCKKELTKPLSLFNGKRICPSCMKEATPIPETPAMKAGSNADELYRLSRSYFFHGIAREIGKEGNLSGMPDYEECFERATSLCLEAALTGHPEAMWNMGYYYDNDFIEGNRTELERCRVAAKYYAAIALHPENEVAGYMGDFKELRVRSAHDLVRMVASLEPRDRSSFSKTIESVRSLGLITSEEVEELFASARGKGASLHRRLEDLFASAVSKKRAPTFGVLFTTQEELLANLDTILSADVVVKTKKLELAYIPLTRDGSYVNMNNDDFVARVTEDNIRARIESDLPEGNVAIYFFNNAGKHGIYNSTGERAKVRRWIEQQDYQAISELINAAKMHPCIFFDDDIFYYHKQERVAADVVKLIQEDI